MLPGHPFTYPYIVLLVLGAAVFRGEAVLLPTCSTDEITVACADGLPVFSILNSGQYPGIDCVAAELMDDASRLGVNGLIDWEHACAVMPQRNQGRKGPPLDFVTTVDVIECTTGSKRTVTFESWAEVDERSMDYELYDCHEESKVVRENFFKCTCGDPVDVCEAGTISPSVFDITDRPDCSAQEVRDILVYGGVARLADWAADCGKGSAES
jgi:hypothetical protein